MLQHRPRRLALAALVGLLAAACSSLFATRIGDILANPRKYDGREVTVAGKVTDTTNLLVVKYFTVSDGTGKIPVVTERPLPREGESITVTGTVEEAFALGDRHLLVLLERRNPR
ncbi:MAG: hypothetical protein HXY19_00930 [Thermoanaerobaculaceae bacterium]|nr:hypothetical protein [Thermoanaerobaculaceae bacterium]